MCVCVWGGGGGGGGGELNTVAKQTETDEQTDTQTDGWTTYIPCHVNM